MSDERLFFNYRWCKQVERVGADKGSWVMIMRRSEPEFFLERCGTSDGSEADSIESQQGSSCFFRSVCDCLWSPAVTVEPTSGRHLKGSLLSVVVRLVGCPGFSSWVWGRSTNESAVIVVEYTFLFDDWGLKCVVSNVVFRLSLCGSRKYLSDVVSSRVEKYFVSSRVEEV